MADFTKEERAAIGDAWRAISYLCDSTNWRDKPDLAEALRHERREAEPGDVLGARAMVIKAWEEGQGNPDTPARRLYYVRTGYLLAFMLGARQRIEREGTDYAGPLLEAAREAAGKAVLALNARTERRLSDA